MKKRNFAEMIAHAEHGQSFRPFHDFDGAVHDDIHTGIRFSLADYYLACLDVSESCQLHDSEDLFHLERLEEIQIPESLNRDGNVFPMLNLDCSRWRFVER